MTGLHAIILNTDNLGDVQHFQLVSLHTSFLRSPMDEKEALMTPTPFSCR